MSENKELQVMSAANIVIGASTDVSGLTLEERVELFQRFSEAQASLKIAESHLNKVLHVTDMTLYQRDFIDADTGMPGLATYASFTLKDGETIKTASSQALPFAMSVARFIGYDPKTGHLPHAIKMQIIPVKADEGFKYNFVFKGLA